MRFISNCGHTTGPNLMQENNPDYVKNTLQQKFSVVVDTWAVSSKEPGQITLALGSLDPRYPVMLEFLRNPNIIARAKNIETYQILSEKGVHCFLDSVDTQITSQGLIWNHVGGRQVLPRTIVNMPEILTTEYDKLLPSITAGVCSNHIATIRDEYNKLSKSRTPTEEKKTMEPIEEEKNDNVVEF